jgi:hypothetical protein
LASQVQPAVEFTPEEAEIFKRLNDKQMRIASQNRQVATGIPETPIKSMSDLYWQNITMLNRAEGFQVEGFMGNVRF